MKNKILFVGILLAAFFCLPSGSFAFVSEDLTSYLTQTVNVYPATWDNLAMDALIPNQKEDKSVDELNFFSVKNTGSADFGREFENVKLWIDAGAVGWQGWGTDKDLGEAAYENSMWIWSGLKEPIPTNGLRVFVTVDIRSTLYVDGQRISAVIPQLNDDNANKVRDAGEYGVFVASKNNGPTNSEWGSTPSEQVSRNTHDVWQPQLITTNLVEGQKLEGVTAYKISGKAKDQGTAGIATIKISINKSGATDNWINITDNGSAFATWDYQWSDITDGTYTVKLKTEDYAGNILDKSYGVTVLAVVSQPVVTTPTTEVAEKVNDGELIKGSGDPKVYVVADGQKHWITTGEVFLGLGYQWSKIKAVSAITLNSLVTGSDVIKAYTHLNGTLIKYKTYPQVFLLQSGYRRHIANEQVFLGLGYHWDDIITVPDTEYYPDGEEITTY
ncbi:MAG: hypothetical protein WC310_00675 [Patescibacteria group bacterium]|jgi:hypothetical protein